jgi:hypothetical protein
MHTHRHEHSLAHLAWYKHFNAMWWHYFSWSNTTILVKSCDHATVFNMWATNRPSYITGCAMFVVPPNIKLNKWDSYSSWQRSCHMYKIYLFYKQLWTLNRTVIANAISSHLYFRNSMISSFDIFRKKILKDKMRRCFEEKKMYMSV